MDPQKVIACYNATAKEYAKGLYNELAGKPFDRMLLRQFANENAAKGPMLDLGCGPGQTIRFLADNGMADILGTDLSNEIIAVAGNLNPDIKFETADMLALPFADSSFGSVVAFYAIVHFDMAQLSIAFQKIDRVLRPGGHFLLSFHIGDEIFHRDEFLVSR
ncbi:class I SAM-dependent methyltransferase [Mucilaginibacter myungsuensis]|uniref:Class I SAM-dependent methyltransferase n=1 Tax=Mucilaginibacter myungsuensis TaxID=649104 RepID=A0A929PW79_9SPHI|nr:class I SAM-dependent methyltransferase [Mucilaginibacter myungsuensis]MBE9662553.1 class I SAM-dependent methyltransferase [Mucilaginibacter myungsuensis]MDN3597972.1 class I SAM-dependent methyltransferase [Mucilaginibacter myungsuensis]